MKIIRLGYSKLLIYRTGFHVAKAGKTFGLKVGATKNLLNINPIDYKILQIPEQEPFESLDSETF